MFLNITSAKELQKIIKSHINGDAISLLLYKVPLTRNEFYEATSKYKHYIYTVTPTPDSDTTVELNIVFYPNIKQILEINKEIKMLKKKRKQLKEVS